MPTQVVNMIPQAQSGEQNQDSEPNLTVNPANPLQIVGSAFTPDPGGGANAPIFVSIDGGNTWALNQIVPSAPATGDITVRFATQGGRLYAGILRAPFGFNLNILRSDDFTAMTPMTRLVDRPNVDQPYVQAATVMSGPNVGVDRVYVGNNAFGGGAPVQSATVDVSPDGGAATPPPPSNFNARFVDPRADTMVEDGPPIRPVAHLDGTVYAAFHRGRSFSGTIFTVDVVVVRDDNWATGATPFTDLVDSGDGQAGQRVVQSITIPYNPGPTFGQERFVCSELTIAVDPRDSNVVYVGFADNNGSTYTLHVMRSGDRGQTWSAADIRTVLNATNPALAINSRGRVGFMYQALTGASPNQRWETHLELTDDDWASVTNLTLATVPASTPVATGWPYLGDYIHLLALGKDFYGIFSANNTPDMANFPQGVTYPRNRDFTTHTLLDTDGVTPVPISIDPFFVKQTELTADQDFYVRDWTNSPTSGDNGIEPSSNPWFYVNPDVWNRTSNAPGAFDANDRPVNQPPVQGVAPMGQNFAFARVRRNGSGSAATVNARFLVSPFGTGSAYIDAGDPAGTDLTFGAGDLALVSDPHEWHLDPTSSTHLCLATEISTATDPPVLPGLLGRTPGWPTTDLAVINDNNKAQRNMEVGPAGIGGGATFHALVRNASYELRDVVLRYAPAPGAGRRLRYTLRTVGGGRAARSARVTGELVLRDMQPGENRWVALELTRGGPEGEPIPVTFHEMVGTAAVSGFAIAPLSLPPREAAHAVLAEHASVFARIAAAFEIDGALDESRRALELIERGRLGGTALVRFLGARIDAIDAVVKELIGAGALRDPFGLAATVKGLRGGRPQQLATLHSTLVSKLDSFVTMIQKSRGDTADILHNVEWQRALLARQPKLAEVPGAPELDALAQRFVAAFEARQAGPDAFPALIDESFEGLTNLADAVGSQEAMKALEEVRQALGSPPLLQRAHRDLLIALASGPR